MRLRNIPGAKEEVYGSRYVVQEPETWRRHWREKAGMQEAALHIEAGMGKGRFIMEQARLHPDILFVGIEMYDSVLIRALRLRSLLELEGESYDNLFFVRMDARNLQDVFAPGEVDRIYLNFSDPWPKARHEDRRLTSGRFLERYAAILSDAGRVEFKTDNQDLFSFSLETARMAPGWRIEASTRDLHADPALSGGNVMTEYEEKFSSQGVPICKLILSCHNR